MKQQILIVEDDIAFGKMIKTFLQRNNFDVCLSISGKEARENLQQRDFDLLITDLKLPEDSGLELLDFSKAVSPKTSTILMTGYAEVSTAVEAIKKGALDYISKP